MAKPLIATVALALAVGAPTVAAAQFDNAKLDHTGLLTDATEHCERAVSPWSDVAQDAAERLFRSLAIISLVWTAGQLALRKADLSEVARELLQFMVFTGFWLWMLRNGPRHAKLIIDGMVDLGGHMTRTDARTPSGLLDLGYTLLGKAHEAASLLSPINSVLAYLLALATLVLLAIVAVNLMKVLITGWFVAYGGVFILGFGGAKWTSDMAINYYRTCLSLGLQALGTVLLAGAGESLLARQINAIGDWVSIYDMAVIAVSAIMLVMLVSSVPAQLGSLATSGGLHYSSASPAVSGRDGFQMAAYGAGKALKVGRKAAEVAILAAVGGAAAAEAAFASNTDKLGPGEAGAGGPKDGGGPDKPAPDGGSAFAATDGSSGAPASPHAGPAMDSGHPPPRGIDLGGAAERPAHEDERAEPDHPHHGHAGSEDPDAPMDTGRLQQHGVPQRRENGRGRHADKPRDSPEVVMAAPPTPVSEGPSRRDAAEEDAEDTPPPVARPLHTSPGRPAAGRSTAHTRDNKKPTAR